MATAVALALAAGSAAPASASAGVSIFADSSGAGLFSGGLLAPGRVQQACVAVQAAGADPADEVVLLAQNVTGGLAGYLTITVEQGWR